MFTDSSIYQNVRPITQPAPVTLDQLHHYLHGWNSRLRKTQRNSRSILFMNEGSVPAAYSHVVASSFACTFPCLLHFMLTNGCSRQSREPTTSHQNVTLSTTSMAASSALSLLRQLDTFIVLPSL
ncbi:hypothetical protein CC79DRAFT_88898 [Sarocladium strictum]